MKPGLIRLFEKRNNGIFYVGFILAQRFYPVQGKVEAGDEVMVHQEGLSGTPTESGWYVATLADGTKAHCRWSFAV